MKTPRVSVGMPVYNGERFLGPAIEAVLAQTYGDLELVIADNASTDATPDICRAYAARDRRIRYVRNATNIGAAGNFNRVFRLSAGEYYKLANADDLCAPELVARCAAVLDAHAGTVLCYARATLIDERGDAIGPYEDGLDLRSPSAPDRFRAALYGIGLVNVFQGLVRSSALRRTRLLGSYLASDVLLIETLTLHGCFHELPERLFLRRLHAGAASSLRSTVSRLAYLDPTIRRPSAPVGWRHLRERLVTIAGAPCSPREKAALLGIAARKAIADRHRLLGELADWTRGTARRWVPAR
ncbi:MAG TPA: glycosyltransferase [Methylomirabilota bacterium]|jgi:glycosyltransferase involved in cell wall biosynthesis|nr:glycosyltransferase [Methylomirabilota bacterium]